VSDRFLTTAETAAELRCHEKTVRRMIGRGELAATFVAGRYLIDPDDLPTAPPRAGLPRMPRSPRSSRRPVGLARQTVREMEAAAQ
jgi:excisionase family DNA binding protein